MNHLKELRRFPSAPLDHVYLENGFDVDTSQAPRELVRYEDVPGLAREIRSKLILKPYRLIGSEVAYLRKRLDLLQRELAPLIGTTEQTLSLWEQGNSIAPASDMLLRLYCARQLRHEITPVAAKITQEQAGRFVERQGLFNIVARRDQDMWLARFEPQEQTVRNRPEPIKVATQPQRQVIGTSIVHADQVAKDVWSAAEQLEYLAESISVKTLTQGHALLQESISVAFHRAKRTIKVLGPKNHVRKYGHETQLACIEE